MNIRNMRTRSSWRYMILMIWVPVILWIFLYGAVHIFNDHKLEDILHKHSSQYEEMHEVARHIIDKMRKT